MKTKILKAQSTIFLKYAVNLSGMKSVACCVQNSKKNIILVVRYFFCDKSKGILVICELTYESLKEMETI